MLYSHQLYIFAIDKTFKRLSVLSSDRPLTKSLYNEKANTFAACRLSRIFRQSERSSRLSADSSAGLSLEWNEIGKLRKVKRNDTTLVEYSYLSDGTKLMALESAGNGIMYEGAMTYRLVGGTLTLEGVSFPCGRFEASVSGSGGVTLSAKRHVTDHLGSVRAVVDFSVCAAEEINDYYPYGERWEDGSVRSSSNRWRFAGKEEQRSFGAPYLDYGARMYSPSRPRWLSMDPLSESSPSVSPYAYCGDNPVSAVDPDGRERPILSKMEMEHIE